MGKQFRDEWGRFKVGGGPNPSSIRSRLIASALVSILFTWWYIVLKEVFHYNKGKLAGEMPIWGYGILLFINFAVFFLWSRGRQLPSWRVTRWIIGYTVAIEVLIIGISVIANH